VQVNARESDVIVEVRLTLDALSEHEVPPFWENLTVPVNPSIALTVMVEETAVPASTVAKAGSDVTEKSGNPMLKVTVAL